MFIERLEQGDCIPGLYNPNPDKQFYALFLLDVPSDLLGSLSTTADKPLIKANQILKTISRLN